MSLQIKKLPIFLASTHVVSTLSNLVNPPNYFELLDSDLDGTWRLKGDYNIGVRLSFATGTFFSARVQLVFRYGADMGGTATDIIIDDQVVVIISNEGNATLSGSVDQDITLSVSGNKVAGIYVNFYDIVKSSP